MPSKPIMPPGRPAKYVKGRDGRPITGLSISSQGRYYATHSKPRKTFGRGFDQAVMKFRRWESSQRGQTAISIHHLAPSIPEEIQDDCVAEGWISRDEASKLIPWPGQVPEDAFYSTVRKLIFQDPTRFAERVGIPEIGYLQDISPPAASATLAKCLEHYESKRKKPSDDEMRKMRQHWEFFVKHVKPAKKLRDVSEENLNQWVDRAFLEYDDGEGSPKTVHHRLKRVFTVLNYCKTKNIDSVNCERLLEAIRAVELPDLNHENPNPISIDEFHKLLKAANGTIWESMLLTMLNLCYYPVDIRTLTTKAIDLEKGVVIFRRAKKNTTRVGVLWDRTRSALSDWMKKSNATDYVYLSNLGTPFTAQGLRNSFRRLRKGAGLGTNVTMDQIRDGAYTAAIQGTESEKQAKIIAGHKFAGETDAYVKRQPQMVADACRAIEKFYFD